MASLICSAKCKIIDFHHANWGSLIPVTCPQRNMNAKFWSHLSAAQPILTFQNTHCPSILYLYPEKKKTVGNLDPHHSVQRFWLETIFLVLLYDNFNIIQQTLGKMNIETLIMSLFSVGCGRIRLKVIGNQSYLQHTKI